MEWNEFVSMFVDRCGIDRAQDLVELFKEKGFVANWEALDLFNEFGGESKDPGECRENLVEYLMRHFGFDVARVREEMKRNYLGVFKSFDDFGEFYAEECEVFHDSSELMRECFDYEKFARKCIKDGSVCVIDFVDSRLHFFRKI